MIKTKFGYERVMEYEKDRKVLLAAAKELNIDNADELFNIDILNRLFDWRRIVELANNKGTRYLVLALYHRFPMWFDDDIIYDINNVNR